MQTPTKEAQARSISVQSAQEKGVCPCTTVVEPMKAQTEVLSYTVRY